MTFIIQLDRALKRVCPTHGVSMGRKNDKKTWRIDFKDEATPAERVAAQNVLDNFDLNTPDLPAPDLLDQILQLPPERLALLKDALKKP